jgi:hypothetical protein
MEERWIQLGVKGRKVYWCYAGGGWEDGCVNRKVLSCKLDNIDVVFVLLSSLFRGSGLTAI